MSKLLFVLFFTFLSVLFITVYAQESSSRNNWISNTIFRLETKVAETNIAIRETINNIKKCETNISNSNNIVNQAKKTGNTQAEKIALDAIKKSEDAKQKNSLNLKLLNEYLSKLKNVIESVKSGGNDAELKAEQFEFENNQEQWLKNKDELILKRLEKSIPYHNNLYSSLKTNAPPPLPGKTFNDLLPGDVILVDKDTSKLSIGYWINKGDKILSSSASSSASHTLIYLKTINGKKMFLDNKPFHGAQIISEDEYIHLYGDRTTDVARLTKVGEPLSEKDGEKLYQVAKQLADEQLKKGGISYNNKIVTGTNYGLSYSGSDMVCSEASRWVLVKAGYDVPETEDKVKKLIGMEYSPADFVKSKYFMITPLYGVPGSNKH